MGALSLLPLTPPCRCCCNGGHKPTTKSFLCSLASRSFRRRRAVAVCRSSGGDGEKPKDAASAFFGEDGVVEDMDGYLNYLSLEYDSVWDTKPAWCQPWTIILAGTSVVACSWVLVHSVVITTAVLSFICAWWYIFLYSYPKAYSNMIAERRKKVASGTEDTYGMEKNQ